MIRVVTFKWKPRAKRGHSEPPHVVQYTAQHVNTLWRMVKSNLSMPFEMVCVTDDWEGLDPNIRPVWLWDEGLEWGGCYVRLRTFSPELRGFIGDRFLVIDLDCVITGDITPLVDRPEEFVINSHKPGRHGIHEQHYNGGMYLMTAGARRQVWEKWRGEASVREVEEGRLRKENSGSDQGWIRRVLGKGEARWTEEDGVYEARQVRNKLPENARIVLFAGKRDPTQPEWQAKPWVREHYR